ALLEKLLTGAHVTIAGRLAGAFRHLGRNDIADDILAAMKSAGFDIRQSDPFEADAQPSSTSGLLTTSTMVGRLEHLWASARETVLRNFPRPPASPRDLPSYLEAVDDIYVHDAYHSLSIEGYRVTPDLIASIASTEVVPDEREGNEKERDEAHAKYDDALAARGYYQAFRLVRRAVARFYRTEDPTFLRENHRAWYRELFAPHVAVGLLDPSLLAGYRRHPVFLRGSRHIPPRWEILGETMPALFDLLEVEPDGAVRAILGHWLFGYLHPFPDGNGRLARFVMNALFATAGYPWTVIHLKERRRYLDSLEQASVGGDIAPFVAFVASQMRRSESRQGLD
ncbi:MAG: Fic family protein, partial [Deltaproteobacteria bacterium]|nr:Fic family protein [Deltaproteobacteria bacterium]